MMEPEDVELFFSQLDEPIPQSYAPEDEETLDVRLVYPTETIQLLPFSPTGPPARGNFEGTYSFVAEVNGGDTNKNKYLYSHRLNRIYLDMKVDFPIHFRWDWELLASEAVSGSSRKLVVRATTVFAEESQAEKRVERCLQHKHPENKENQGGLDATVLHVLHSARPPHTPGVHYCGVEAEPLSWYSVLVEFPPRPEQGAIQFSHAYSFYCKSSCSNGINRRPIEVIFTLEDFNTGEVLGRQSVGVRVCSCPRRDLSKDEACSHLQPGKRRKSNQTAAPPPPGKRVKTEPGEDLRVFQLNIIGEANYLKVLDICRAYTVAAMSESKDEKEIYAQQIKLYDEALKRSSDNGPV